jgi:hypothetical protein
LPEDTCYCDPGRPLFTHFNNAEKWKRKGTSRIF